MCPSRRLRLGWSVERILTTTKATHQYALLYRGREYSLVELARLVGITSQGVKWRLDRGMSIGQILRQPARRQIEFAGRSRSAREWSMETGIPQRVINDRLKSGWAIERALSEPVAQRRRETKRPAVGL